MAGVVTWCVTTLACVSEWVVASKCNWKHTNIGCRFINRTHCTDRNFLLELCQPDRYIRSPLSSHQSHTVNAWTSVCEPAHITETKRYGNCHTVKEEGIRETGGWVGVGEEQSTRWRWKLVLGISGDKRSGYFCPRALMNAALSSRWIRKLYIEFSENGSNWSISYVCLPLVWEACH